MYFFSLLLLEQWDGRMWLKWNFNPDSGSPGAVMQSQETADFNISVHKIWSQIFYFDYNFFNPDSGQPGVIKFSNFHDLYEYKEIS